MSDTSPRSDTSPSSCGTAQEKNWGALRSDLCRFVTRRVRDAALPEDIVQDVFLKVHEQRDQLQDEDRLGAWGYRIARHAIVDQYRRQGRRLTELSLTNDSDSAGSYDAQMAPESGAEDDELNATVASWLEPMIGQLPKEFRTALQLSELDGVPQPELASQLGLSPSGARTRVQRGRKKLLAELDACCQVERDRRGNVLSVEGRSDYC